MADTPSIPPSPVSVQQGQQAAPDTAENAQAPVVIVRAAPVEKAPPLPPQTQNATPVSLSGEVVKNNASTDTVRITTPQGTVEIKTTTPIPAGTKVTVEIVPGAQPLLANILVERSQLPVLREAQAALQKLPSSAPPVPIPALKTGDVVPVLRMQNETVQPLPLAQPVSLEKIAQTIDQIKSLNLPLNKIELSSLPSEIKNILQAPDTLSALKAAPATFQEKILGLFSNDSFLSSLKNILPEESWKSLNLPQPLSAALSSAAAPPPPQDSLMAFFKSFMTGISEPSTYFSSSPSSSSGIIDADDNLLPLMRAQASLQITQKILETPTLATSGTPAGGLLSSIPLLAEALTTLSASDKINTSLSSLVQSMMSFDRSAALAGDKALLPKNLFQMEIVDIKPPNTSPPTTAKIDAPTPLLQIGEVETVTPNGFPIIKTKDDSFVLRTPVSVPIGSQITFKVTPVSAQQILSTVNAPQNLGALDSLDASFEPLRDIKWPALEETLRQLAKISPETLQNVQNTIPSPTAKLAPTTLLFLAALRLGEIKNWLGDDTLRTLRSAGKRELVDKLVKDFGRLSQQSKDPLPGEWRAISMPMLHDEHLTQAQFFVRQQFDDKNDKDTDKKPTTRFVLNMNFSRMGALQMDGYIRQKNFDMVLRTAQALSLDTRQQIMQRFSAGLDQVNMQGVISFQTREQGWVTPETSDKKGVVA